MYAVNKLIINQICKNERNFDEFSHKKMMKARKNLNNSDVCKSLTFIYRRGWRDGGRWGGTSHNIICKI